MTTSPTTPLSPPSPSGRVPLRLRLRDTASADLVGGAWWPQSRDLQVEAADLVDHLPVSAGYVDRLLFSRPDWDNPVVDGRGVRRIRASRGVVKVGSFPSDDTQLMVLALAGGRRLRLRVIPSDTDPAEADRLLQAIASADADVDPGADGARWDDEASAF